MPLPLLLSILSAITMAIAGLTAHLAQDWWLENMVIALFFAGLYWQHQRGNTLPNSAVWMLFALLCLHEYGTAFSYQTPLGESLKPWLGTDRNHYDRLVHFFYGVLTVRAFRIWNNGSRLLAIQTVLATSALYEMAEWLVTAAVDPALGAEFVGAQGDDFDAAKDMALALAGAVLATLAFERKAMD